MTFTALLLAGGESRRMGVDKATLAFAGEPLWQRQFNLLHSSGPEVIWISARARPRWCPPDLTVVLDAPPSHGPLSGIAAALSQMRTTHLLALAVDMPAMSLEFLRKLRDLCRPGCGVIPANGDFFEPLAAIYPIESANKATEALRKNELSLQTFARSLCESQHLRSCALSEAERALFQNLNEPQDIPSDWRNARPA